jgi:hypothetical protein
VSLPSNIRHIVPRVCFCGNIFSESLPSNEYTRHNNASQCLLNVLTHALSPALTEDLAVACCPESERTIAAGNERN